MIYFIFLEIHMVVTCTQHTVVQRIRERPYALRRGIDIYWIGKEASGTLVSEASFVISGDLGQHTVGSLDNRRYF